MTALVITESNKHTKSPTRYTACLILLTVSYWFAISVTSYLGHAATVNILETHVKLSHTALTDFDTCFHSAAHTVP